MKKDAPFIWDDACCNAFESIKRYMANPLVLGDPVPGKLSSYTLPHKRVPFEHSWPKKMKTQRKKHYTT
ncbi:hypothetical protein ACFX11_035078 [Malus domestica]